MPLLESAKYQVSIISTFYRRFSIYNRENSALPNLGDEGLTEGRPPMEAQSEFSNINGATLVNSGKIETTKELSISIIYFQKSKGNIIPHMPSQKILKK